MEIGPQLQSPHPHHGGQAVGDDKGKEEARTHPVHLHPQMAGEGLQKDRQQVDQQHQQAPLAGLDTDLPASFVPGDWA